MLMRRNLVNGILRDLDNPYILIVVGARQTGKTSLLLYLQEKVLTDRKVSYVSLEDPEFLSLLNAHPENLFDIIGSSPERHLVLMDEIQYLKDPSHFLKYHFDFNREKVKLVVTGSSAFYLDQKFRDSLAGRKRVFFLKPLNLVETLRFKGMEIPGLTVNREEFIRYPLLYRNEMASVLREMMVYGSYPAVVLEKDPQHKKEILSELVDSYTRKDILEAGIKARDDYFRFLKLVAFQVGGLLNVTQVASSLGIARSKVERFLFAGLKSFRFCRITPFFRNVRKELSKTPKIYFYDCGFRNALLRNFTPLELREDRGALFENFIFNFLGDLFDYQDIRFWRSKDKKEIDFIVEQQLAVEARYSEALVHPGRYKGFLEKYPYFLFYFLIFERSRREAKPLAESMRKVYFL